MHIFQFSWDHTVEGVIKRMLLGKPPTDSTNIAKGLVKLLRAWRKTEEAQQWRQDRSAQYKVLLRVTSVSNLASLEQSTAVPDDDFQAECIERSLSVPNFCWDMDCKDLQQHFTSLMQPLVEALTDFANTIAPKAPHVSIAISNYQKDDAYSSRHGAPAEICRSRLETKRTCGCSTAECAAVTAWRLIALGTGSHLAQALIMNLSQIQFLQMPVIKGQILFEEIVQALASQMLTKDFATLSAAALSCLNTLCHIVRRWRIGQRERLHALTLKLG